jgi:hypothetical protein
LDDKALWEWDQWYSCWWNGNWLIWKFLATLWGNPLLIDLLCIDLIGSWKDFANHLFVRISPWISWNYRSSHGSDSKVYIGKLDEWNTQILSNS